MVENLNREELNNAIKKTRESFDTDNPTVPFIEGDGIGIDIWPASQVVFDAVVEKAYNGNRKINWVEVLAGQKAFDTVSEWLPKKTLDTFDEFGVGIKGPLTTPVGEGIRSINVAIRQELDLYVCLRPIKYFKGIETPTKNPQDVDIVLFRENTEDVYSGKELEEGTEEVLKLNNFLKEEFGWEIRKDSGIGIKPISNTGSERLIRAAINFAVENDKKNLAIVHKGNIMKFTEGGFKTWGYEVARQEFGEQTFTWAEWDELKKEHGEAHANEVQRKALHDGKLLIKDIIADNFLQQILIAPKDYSVVATLNLNGDYISDALAAEVGGIGIAPGANINYNTGYAVFEATHGTAPKFAGTNSMNPSSVILSGCMLLEYIGWHEAAKMIEEALQATIMRKQVTIDFYNLMTGATLLKTTEFGDALIENMGLVIDDFQLKKSTGL